MSEWIDHEVGDSVVVRSTVVGFAESNCYVLACRRTREAAVVDPGADTLEETDRILAEVARLDASLRFIVNTHGHPDHFSGNDAVKAALGGEVCIHTKDAVKLTDATLNASRMFGFDVSVAPADRLLNGGDTLDVGDVRLTVRDVPGHSVGGIVLVGDGFVLTGDTLFAGSVGRTDLPASSDESDAWDDLVSSIREKLLTLPGDTIVLPGHGPATTIAAEIEGNLYIR